MFKFIHAADIHLDSPLLRLGQYDDSPSDLLRTATRQALARLVDLAIEEQVAFVVIAGDLYDGEWDDVRTGLVMVAQMRRLREAGIRVFLIAGNHDAASRMTHNIPLPENVTLFGHRRPETSLLEKFAVAIHGQSFARPSVSENLAANYPLRVAHHFNIGLLHTSLDGREGHANYAPCSHDDLVAKGYDYWALGHIHQREIVNQQPLIVFSGNLQGRHIRECGPKGVILVTVDDGRVETDFRAVDVVRWERVTLRAAGSQSPEDVLEGARRALQALRHEHSGMPLAVRIELTGLCPCHAQLQGQSAKWENDLRAIASDLGSGEIWLEKIKFLTQPISSGNAVEGVEGPLAEVGQLIGMYRSDDQALRELAGELRELRDKLPSDLTQGTDPLNVDSPEWLRAVLVGVEPLLLARLHGDARSREAPQ